MAIITDDTMFKQIYDDIEKEIIGNRNDLFSNISQYQNLRTDITSVKILRTLNIIDTFKLTLMRVSDPTELSYTIKTDLMTNYELIIIVPDNTILSELGNREYYETIKYIFKMVTYFYIEVSPILSKFKDINKQFNLDYIEYIYPVLFLLNNGKDIPLDDIYRSVPKTIQLVDDEENGYIDLFDVIQDCIGKSADENIERLFVRGELDHYKYFN